MIKKIAVILLFLFLLLPAYAGNYDLVLQWDENTEPDLATGERPRYKIYISNDGSLAGDKANAEQVIDQLVSDDENSQDEYVQRTLKDMDDQAEYAIAVTALDEWQNESDLSDEVITDNTAPGAPTGTTGKKVIINIIIN